MTSQPEPAGYWCEVLAEGFVCGTGESARYVLATYQTISPVLALRWLRSEALRIADRIDLDPLSSGWVHPSMLVASMPLPECPAELRAWTIDQTEEREARQHLKGGHPMFAKFLDTDCTYTLSVWPVGLSTDEGAPLAPEPICHRIGGLSHPLYVLAEDPWRWT
ncbi:hypothetical protein [Streptomyces sp. NPDC051636]|uniref:hypothetical protein n=1 Tax=Streptomyces sp. NPDC051636 TaxID=3365663 RepID=UPI0037ACDD1D